ncbi:MAG: hypothetical protein H0U75_12400 [Legionella sp.]|nr:hypothetical protein [Legionella sp.]
MKVLQIYSFTGIYIMTNARVERPVTIQLEVNGEPLSPMQNVYLKELEQKIGSREWEAIEALFEFTKITGLKLPINEKAGFLTIFEYAARAHRKYDISSSEYHNETLQYSKTQGRLLKLMLEHATAHGIRLDLGLSFFISIFKWEQWDLMDMVLDYALANKVFQNNDSVKITPLFNLFIRNLKQVPNEFLHLYFKIIKVYKLTADEVLDRIDFSELVHISLTDAAKVDILAWIIGEASLDSLSKISHEVFASSMSRLISLGNLEIAKKCVEWALKAPKGKNQYLRDMMRQAIDCGHFHIATWIAQSCSLKQLTIDSAKYKLYLKHLEQPTLGKQLQECTRLSSGLVSIIADYAGLLADSPRVLEQNCGLVKLSLPPDSCAPNEAQFSKFKNSRYILTNTQLFYYNKARNTCAEVGVTQENLATIHRLFPGDKTHKLSGTHLEQIGLLTSGHRREQKTGDFSSYTPKLDGSSVFKKVVMWDERCTMAPAFYDLMNFFSKKSIHGNLNYLDITGMRRACQDILKKGGVFDQAVAEMKSIYQDWINKLPILSGFEAKFPENSEFAQMGKAHCQTLCEFSIIFQRDSKILQKKKSNRISALAKLQERLSLTTNTPDKTGMPTSAADDLPIPYLEALHACAPSTNLPSYTHATFPYSSKASCLSSSSSSSSGWSSPSSSSSPSGFFAASRKRRLEEPEYPEPLKYESDRVWDNSDLDELEPANAGQHHVHSFYNQPLTQRNIPHSLPENNTEEELSPLSLKGQDPNEALEEMVLYGYGAEGANF